MILPTIPSSCLSLHKRTEISGSVKRDLRAKQRPDNAIGM